MKIRRYSELILLPSFLERFDYLKLSGSVAYETFGIERHLNQDFYRSSKWQSIRRDVIVRDMGCDLGIKDRPIDKGLYIHHMNPISREDILEQSDMLLDPEFLICCTFETHNAIHYGSSESLVHDPTVRTPYDTCPWKGGSRCREVS